MVKPETTSHFSHWPNRVAKLLAVIVLPFIWAGGLVTTSDAGMAVPDWPNTYNYNMFAYPIRDWFLGPWDLFVEHGHRLLGSLSGIVAIGLCVVTFALDRRASVRLWSILILALVIGQGILGGQRVVRDERTLALLHGCVGPLFFATVVAMVVCTSTWWIGKRGVVAERQLWSTDGQRIVAALMMFTSYAQLIFGACLRHVSDQADFTVYALLIVAHLVTAGIVLLLAGGVLYLASARNWSQGGIRTSAMLMLAFVIFQIGMGCTTYILKFGWPAWLGGYSFAARYVVPEKTFLQMNLITLHVAMGSLILATAAYHYVRVCRAIANRPMEKKPPIPSVG